MEQEVGEKLEFIRGKIMKEIEFIDKGVALKLTVWKEYGEYSSEITKQNVIPN